MLLSYWRQWQWWSKANWILCVYIDNKLTWKKNHINYIAGKLSIGLRMVGKHVNCWILMRSLQYATLLFIFIFVTVIMCGGAPMWLIYKKKIYCRNGSSQCLWVLNQEITQSLKMGYLKFVYINKYLIAVFCITVLLQGFLMCLLIT